MGKLIQRYGIYFELTQTGAEMLSYVEVYDDMWSVRVCSCVDCNIFLSYNIVWRSWQARKKLYIFNPKSM